MRGAGASQTFFSSATTSPTNLPRCSAHVAGGGARTPQRLEVLSDSCALSPIHEKKCHTRHTTRERTPRTHWTRVHHAHTSFTTHSCRGPSHSLTHSLTLSLTHSPSHSLTHSLTLSLSHSYIQCHTRSAQVKSRGTGVHAHAQPAHCVAVFPLVYSRPSCDCLSSVTSGQVRSSPQWFLSQSASSSRR